MSDATTEGRLVALEALAKTFTRWLQEHDWKLSEHAVQPAPPITRERLAAELCCIGSAHDSDEWERRIRRRPDGASEWEALRVADRAIELLAPWADKAVCTYCGHVGSKEPAAMVEHMAECEKSPYLQIVDQLAVVIRERDEARAEVESLKSVAGQLMLDNTTRVKEETPPALDVERLAKAMQETSEIPRHEHEYWQHRASDVIAAYGATALPPVPQGDEGPKAIDAAYQIAHGPPVFAWEENDSELQNARRAQWSAAVRILRPDAAHAGKEAGR